MPSWSNVAPEPRDFANIRLMRVPAKGNLLGIITSEEVIGCYTHWDKSRTQPCPDKTCTKCHEGIPRRWQAWISLVSQVTDRQIVVQVSPLAHQALDEARAKYGYLRGLLCQLSRQAPRENARIIVDTRQLPKPPDGLPPPVDIQRYMENIWQEKQHLARSADYTAKIGKAVTP